MTSIFVIVCPNGTGHYFRQTGVLAEVLRRRPDVNITLAITQQQLNCKTPAAAELWSNGAQYDLTITTPGVQLSGDNVYDDGQLINWVERLRSREAFWNADLVVSDNLVGPLGYRPDVLLAGNFLWADVFGSISNPAATAFAEYETALLKAHKPRMLCVDRLASSSVRNLTRPITVGWMVQSMTASASPESRANNIAVFGGGTSLADSLLAEAVSCLLAQDKWRVHAPKSLVDSLGKPGLHVLPAKMADYSKFAFVVGRPGGGTITACVETNTPLIAVHEPGNREMFENGSMLNRYGLGFGLGQQVDALSWLSSAVAYGDLGKHCREALTAEPKSGIQEAASYICSLL